MTQSHLSGWVFFLRADDVLITYKVFSITTLGFSDT